MTALQEMYRKARRYLVRRDPILKTVMAQVGPCTLTPHPDRLGILVRSIVAQQISTRAALAIHANLQAALGNITPRSILAAPTTLLRSAGLSANKLRSLRDLAEKVESGVVPLDDMHELDDEAVIERLLPVRGIGRWTAQMFLIFSLGRLDVLPVDDFGLRAGVQRHYGLAELPSKARLTELGEAWRPYRTVATWYLWRSLGPVPGAK